MDFNLNIGDDQKQQSQGYGSSEQKDEYQNYEPPQSKQIVKEESTQDSSSAPKNLGACPFLNIEYYQPYFDITQQEVFQRIKLSLFSFKATFFEISRNSPDLWGPFWICTTLVFMVASVGNFESYLASDDKNKYKFNYDYVPIGAAVVYSIGFGTPILLTVMMKCFSTEVTFFQMICLYGYSMVPYVPVVMVCIIPVEWLQWLLLCISCLVSIAFMVTNLWSEFARYQDNKKYISLGFVVGTQVLFLFILKLYFLKLFYEVEDEQK